MFNNFYQHNAGTQVAVVQTVKPRNFRIQYREGMAVTNHFEYLPFLLENNSDVTIVEEPTLEVAYVNACTQYVQDFWQRKPYRTPALPTFEDILKMPYHEPGFIPNVPSVRFFAAINQYYVGIYDSVKGAVEFWNNFNPSGLKEFDSADKAKLWLNEKFVLPILPMSAYISPTKSLIIRFAIPTTKRIVNAKNLPQKLNAKPCKSDKILLQELSKV